MGRPLTVSSPSPEQAQALLDLASLLPSDAYLAGGVAIAARLHHRTSRDLDWFVSRTDPLTLVDPLTAAGARIVSRGEGTLYVELAGVPTSIIRYGYPLLEPLELLLGVRVASLEDLACMKLSAIASRGKARDFWDLREILAHTGRPLTALLEAYGEKYKQHDVGHVIRSLVYFDDAEAEPMPRGLETMVWRSIKQDLRERVLAL